MTNGGRTAWDAVVDVFKLLGKGGPYVLILVGSAYAMYMFFQFSEKHTDDMRKSQLEFTKNFQDQITATNEVIRKTYAAIATISSDQVKTINDLFKLSREAIEHNQQLFAQTEDRRKQLDDAKSQFDEVTRVSKATEAALVRIRSELDSNRAAVDALGIAVDEAPELLRSLVTTNAVQSVLQRSEQLAAHIRKPSLLLAFAELQGFVGDAVSQEKLAAAALNLISELRSSDRVPAEIDGDEAAARMILGTALGAQGKLDEEINQIKISLKLFEVALTRGPDELSRSRLEIRKAEAYRQLGWTSYKRRHDRAEAVAALGSSLELVERLAREDNDDPVRKQAVAWAHCQIADIELQALDIDAAFREYERARALMQELGVRVYRNSEWLERFARIYNGTALAWGERAAQTARDRGANDEIVEALDQELDQLQKARRITEDLARDRKNLAWQTVHGWSLHNMGEAKLARNTVMHDNNGELDESVALFEQAVEIRRRLTESAPRRDDWQTDLLWSSIQLNRARAIRAERSADYSGMADFLYRNMQLLAKADLTDDNWKYRDAENRMLYANALRVQNQVIEAKSIYNKVRDVAKKAALQATEKNSSRRWDELISRIDADLR
jgi:hypothetical protein